MKKTLKLLSIVCSIFLLLYVQFNLQPKVKFEIYKMLGGLAIFIYGMTRMTKSLGVLAGENIKKIFEKFTGNPFMGLISGIIVTSLIQSSSATTVMVVGFVNSGMMTIHQAIGVIIGANIGTTITGQLIAFKISKYAYLFIVFGLLLSLIAKSKKNQSVGQCMIGFGLLFVGMDVMKEVVKPLKDSAYTLQMIQRYSDNKLFGVFVGTIFTLILQSSSATVGITMTIAGAGVIKFPMAVALILGDNIGTTITAIIASFAANRNAKRAAFAHSLFNIMGVTVILIIFPIYLRLVKWLSPAGAKIERLIANAHSYFNITNALIFICLVKLLAAICFIVFPKTSAEKEMEGNVLDKRLLTVPSLAFSNVNIEINRMSRLVWDSMEKMTSLFREFDYKKYESIKEQEDIIDNICEEINHYLILIQEKTLSRVESQKIIIALHLTSELEKIADQIEILIEIQRDVFEQKINFGPEALCDINNLGDAVEWLFKATLKVVTFTRPNPVDIQMVFARSVETIELERHCYQGHVNRLAKGICNQKNGLLFLKMLENYQKSAGSCKNVASYLSDFYQSESES